MESGEFNRGCLQFLDRFGGDPVRPVLLETNSTLEGIDMHKFCKNPLVVLTLGTVLGASVISFWPQEKINAATANSSDLFSIVTVPCEGGINTETVFVLDHLNGILRGGFLHDQQGVFTHAFIRNVGADFQVRPGAKEPMYAIAAGQTNLAATGGNQPARGIIYIAEKSSGAVMAYGYPIPRGAGAAGPGEIVRLDGFSFRDPIGQ